MTEIDNKLRAEPGNPRTARKARAAKRFRLFARTVMEKVSHRRPIMLRYRSVGGKLYRLHPTRGWKAV